MNAAQQAALRLLTKLPVRTVSARTAGKPPPPTKEDPALLERDAKIRHLYAQGWTMERIGRAVGRTKSSVWKRLKRKK